MVSTKEKDRSLIFCLDADFKRRLTGMLIEAAFPAEKYCVKTVKEAREAFKSHDRVVNIVMNGADFEGKEIFKILTEIRDMFLERAGTKILIYLDEDQYESLPDELKKTPGRITFFKHPVSKVEINSVFNPIKKPKLVAVPGGAQKPQGKKNVNFYETSKHVQETITSLNALKNKPGNLKALEKIGQRFNGIFGAFSFVQEKPGYRELCYLSHLIDDVARHYENGDKKNISQEHLALMLEAAKCSFAMLKLLRDSQPLTPNHNKAFELIEERFNNHPEIERRSETSQDDVDAMISAAECFLT